MLFFPSGKINGMRCTQIWYPETKNAWKDNYLCAPTSTSYYFQWSYDGTIPNLDCIHWNEPVSNWDDGYLCMSSNPGNLKIQLTLSISNSQGIREFVGDRESSR